jgi:hypothetical protein
LQNFWQPSAGINSLASGERERTVTEIALAIGAFLQSASQHLRIMGFSNLVESRREHHNIYYHLADNELLKFSYDES